MVTANGQAQPQKGNPWRPAVSGQGTTANLPLSGLKVVDLATWIAGPAAATIMAMYGADVLKVEQEGAGDPLRTFFSAPGMPAGETNFTWPFGAASKGSLSFDLRSPGGVERLHKLAADADVFIINTPLERRESLGQTYEQLSACNPKLIVASVTAYGESGPDSKLRGFDNIALWGRSGLMDLFRRADGTPMRTVPAAGDFMTSLAVLSAICIALIERTATGRGTYVSSSLLANGVWANAFNVQAALSGADLSGIAARQEAPASIIHCPYLAEDGVYIQFGHFRTDEQRSLVFVVADLVEYVDADLDTQIDALRRRIATRSSDEWLGAFRSVGLIVDCVASTEMVVRDAQVQSNCIEPYDDSDGALVRPPFAVGVHRLRLTRPTS